MDAEEKRNAGKMLEIGRDRNVYEGQVRAICGLAKKSN